MKQFNYLLIIAMLVLYGCGSSDKEKDLERQRQAAKERKAEAEAFKVGVLPTMDCLPIYLLKDSVLYDTAKVDIRLKPFTAQMDCDTAMIGRSVQACVTDLIRAERLKAKRRVPLIYLTETNASWQLVVNKKSNVKKLADLSDKIVAMARHSITDYLTNKIIDKAKPKYAVYKAQINDVLVRQKMLQADEVDAIWASEPQTTQVRLAGNTILYNSAEDQFVPGAIVFVDSGDAQQQAEFQEAYNKAVDLINRNGVQHYAALIEKYMKVNEQVVAALPKTTFKRIITPRPVDIIRAQRRKY